jgi:hypothetical protein
VWKDEDSRGTCYLCGQPAADRNLDSLEIQVGRPKASSKGQAQSAVFCGWELVSFLERLEGFGNESEMLARHRGYIL